MNTLMIILTVWIIGGLIAYFYFIKKMENKTSFEKIWYSVVWPALIPLYIIHVLNKAK